MVFHVEQVKYLSFLYRLMSNMLLILGVISALGHVVLLWFSFKKRNEMK